MAAADLAGGLIPEAESGDWVTVENLNGAILEVKVSKTKASQGKTTTTKALLYNRWDEDLHLYEDGDEGAESWLEVIPKYYGMERMARKTFFDAKAPSMKSRPPIKPRTWSPATTTMRSRARATATAAAAVTATAMPMKAKSSRSRSRPREKGLGCKGNGLPFFIDFDLRISRIKSKL